MLSPITGPVMVDANGSVVPTQTALEVQPDLEPLPAISVSLAPVTTLPVQA